MGQMQLNRTVAGVILAGGPGTRMGGWIKALLEVGGIRNVDRLLATFQGVFSEVFLSVRDAAPYAGLGVSLAEDRMDVRSSLTGIHAGLVAAKAEYVFVCAGDAPFLRPEVVRLLLDEVQEDRDIIIPLKDDGYMEPLCAIYSKRCLQPIASQLAQGDCKIIRFFDQMKVHRVPVSRLREVDPNLRSFMNMNTPEELAAARELAAQGMV